MNWGCIFRKFRKILEQKKSSYTVEELNMFAYGYIAAVIEFNVGFERTPVDEMWNIYYDVIGANSEEA